MKDSNFYAKIVRGNDLIGHNLIVGEGGASGTFLSPLNVPLLLSRTILQKKVSYSSRPMNEYFFLLFICMIDLSPIHLLASG